jgi:RHS repeat-associated protein
MNWRASHPFRALCGKGERQRNDGNTYYTHQDWEHTDRMHTDPNGGIADTYTSLPYGDEGVVTGSGYSAWDFNHFGDLDYNSESNTYHAQFRQYNQPQGRWMQPDPYSGSYDYRNPQSLNRYAYASDNPLSFTDASGLDVCDNWGCDDPGGCDPIFYNCDPYGGYGGDGGSYGPPPPPKIVGFKNLDPKDIMTESLGLPAGMQLPSGDILDIFGIGTGTQCEFGACGNISESWKPGDVASAAAPIDLSPWIFRIFAFAHALKGGSPEGADQRSTLSYWPLNGSLWPGFQPQDGVCTTGPFADKMNSNPNILNCCKAHDNCYTKYHCNASSFIGGLPGPCKLACNAKEPLHKSRPCALLG